jgi:hypothetical protein
MRQAANAKVRFAKPTGTIVRTPSDVSQPTRFIPVGPVGREYRHR